MADLIIISIIILVLYKLNYNKNGFNADYLSVETSTALRGFMVLDVMLFHYGCLDSLNVKHYFLNMFQGDDAVKIFFFLSGYGLLYSYQKKGQDYLKGFFSRRFVKILLPFALAAIFYGIVFAHTGSYYGVDFTFKNVVTQFICKGYPIVYNSWYVFELLAMYLIFFLSFKISKGDTNRGLNIAVVSTMLLMLAFYVAYVKAEWMHIWFYSTYAFAFGMIWSAKEKEIVSFIQKHFNTLVITLVPAVIMLIIFRRNAFTFYDTNTQIIIKNLLLGPFIILGVIVGSMKFKFGCRVWHWLGSISYELFLIHGLFYLVFRGEILYIKNDLLFIAAGFACSIAAAAILHFINNTLLKGYLKLIDKKR